MTGSGITKTDIIIPVVVNAGKRDVISVPGIEN